MRNEDIIRREELERVFSEMSDEERLAEFIHVREALDAITDEAYMLRHAELTADQIVQGLIRIERLAEERNDFRSREQIDQARKFREESF